MEIYKKLVHNINCKKSIVSQITLEEDYIVPDSKGDIRKIIEEEGWMVIDEAKASNGHVNVNGNLQFKNLYVTDDASARLECINGAIPFNEIINIDEAQSNDVIRIDWNIEDFSISMINSRKISTKALITFTVFIEELTDQGICVEIREDSNAKALMNRMDLLELAVNKKDIFRIKDEISIPSNKPNIDELIWESCQIRNVDIRPMDNMLMIKGEILVFVIYKSQDDKGSIVWLENTVNFSGNVECAESTSDMIADVEYAMVNMNIESRADYDGELRVIGVDGALELDIKLYENTNLNYLSDVYLPGKEVVINEKECNIGKLVVRNISRCKVSERIPFENEKSRVLQICHCTADARIDESMIIDDGINVEGFIELTIIYITIDDETPFESIKATIPFTNFIQAENIKETSKIKLKPRIEQITAVMSGTDELEIKAVIGIDTFVTNTEQIQMIDTVEEENLDYSKLDEMPGIAVYFVQENDNLWKLAKKYYTTVEKIKEVNNLQSDNLSKGDKLILLKDVF